MSLIRAGYRLTVVSWENDGDNYNTKIRDGLVRAEVEIDLEFIRLFRGRFGNIYDPDTGERKALQQAVKEIAIKVAEKYPFHIWKEILDENDDDVIIDYFMESMYDYGLTGGEQFTRNLDKFIVEYVPEQIEIEDVTEQFKNG